MVSQHINWINTRTYCTDKNILFTDKTLRRIACFQRQIRKFRLAPLARNQLYVLKKMLTLHHRSPTRALWEISTGELQFLSLLTIKFAGLFLLKTQELPGAPPPGPPAHGPTRKGTRTRYAVRARIFSSFFFFSFLFCRLRCRMVLPIPISMIGKKWHASPPPPPPPINFFFFWAGRNGSRKILNTPLEKILGTRLVTSNHKHKLCGRMLKC